MDTIPKRKILSIPEKEKALDLLYQMLLIRRFEERSAELYTAQKIRGFLHLYIGEEAIAVGVMDGLEKDDAVLATYREHGHALARGMSPHSIMAEMYGKVEGCSRGRGGSMHLFDAALKFYGGNAIVGGHLPMAVGMALGNKMQGNDQISCCFFGEGAVAEGAFHESLNLAALWKLPILFVCENNMYAMGTALEISESEMEVYKKAGSYKIASELVDGMDVLAVQKAAKEAITYIRRSKNPFLLECRTYRFKAHSMFDAQLYRDKSEVEEWKKKGPIVTYKKRLEAAGLLDEKTLESMEARVSIEIEEAVQFAENGHWESLEDLTKFVYSS